jgi:hypothetical protein
MKAPTKEERERVIRENFKEKEKDESDKESDDDDDVNVIVYSSISNPKYIAIYDSIVKFLKTKKGWTSRGKVRDGCKKTVNDARELGQLQGRYSEIYEGDVCDVKQILWKKVGREYEYSLA